MVEITGGGLKTVSDRAFDDYKPVVGDQFRTLVTWKGGDDPGVPEGARVCLRFKLDQAKLFFLDFE